MRSRSFTVIDITLGGFTPLEEFKKLFEALTTVGDRWQVAFNSPWPLNLYTKAAVKANPREPPARDG
jgi:hypothetical protein